MIVIYCSEDGDHSIYQMTREEAAKKFEDCVKDGCPPKFATLEQIKKDSGMECMGDTYIVIDGDLIVPKPIQVATKFQL